MKADLRNIVMFHTHRSREFKNDIIDDALTAFANSLSHKACQFDKAVAEATFKIIKTDFIYGTKFDTLEQLQIGFVDYVNLFNDICIHCSLGYITPA